MSEYEPIEIIDYITKVRQASVSGDKEAIDKLIDLYGGEEATFNDVEEANAYTIQLLAANYETMRTMLMFKIDALTDVLIKNKAINQEDLERIDAELTNIMNRAKGEDINE